MSIDNTTIFTNNVDYAGDCGSGAPGAPYIVVIGGRRKEGAHGCAPRLYCLRKSQYLDIVESSLGGNGEGGLYTKRGVAGRR